MLIDFNTIEFTFLINILDFNNSD